MEHQADLPPPCDIWLLETIDIGLVALLRTQAVIWHPFYMATQSEEVFYFDLTLECSLIQNEAYLLISTFRLIQETYEDYTHRFQFSKAVKLLPDFKFISNKTY